MIDKILVAIKNAASNPPVFYLKLAIAYLGSIIMCKLFVIQIATYLIRQKTVRLSQASPILPVSPSHCPSVPLSHGTSSASCEAVSVIDKRDNINLNRQIKCLTV